MTTPATHWILVFWSGVYGASKNAPGSGYDERCDFNNDGFDDNGDFGILVGDSGQSGQEYATNLRTGL